jgi:Universal stress protein family
MTFPAAGPKARWQRPNAHARGGMGHHAPLGSISNKVLHRAECPVVVVPARK